MNCLRRESRPLGDCTQYGERDRQGGDERSNRELRVPARVVETETGEGRDKDTARRSVSVGAVIIADGQA